LARFEGGHVQPIILLKIKCPCLWIFTKMWKA
jgi:hypothetical protein